MGVTTKVVIGLVKGMGGRDVEKLIENLPEEIGKQAGTFISQAAGGSVEPLRAWLGANAAGVLELWSQLCLRETFQRDDATWENTIARIPILLDVINAVLSPARILRSSFVLGGFVHTPDCLSYWHFKQRPDGTAAHFEANERLTCIHMGSRKAPTVYLLRSDETGDDAVRELNRQIRRLRDGQLPRDVYSELPYVQRIDEFSLEVGGLGMKWDARDVEVPEGLPGVPRMFATLDLAIAEHRGPADRARDAFSKATGTSEEP